MLLSNTCAQMFLITAHKQKQLRSWLRDKYGVMHAQQTIT